MRFHEKLTQIAGRKGLSQRDVGRLASELLAAQGREPIATTTMNRIFNGSSVPDLYESAAIARVIGAPLAFLADDAMASPPADPREDEDFDQLVKNASVIGFKEANERILNYGVKHLPGRGRS